MSLPNWVRKCRRAAFSHLGHKAKSVARLARGADAETVRRRALDDARGQVLRAGCTFTAAGEQRWQVVRSRRGRTDQRDVLVNGQLFKTCGPRRLPAWLR